ncbi:unnamed protein product [Closterium sp. NIES-65]|nr:unnamed protein product [Closterium sp. NIES-65]
MGGKISQRGGAPLFSRFPAASALIFLLACCRVSPTRGSAFKVTDAYSPACGKIMTEPPAGGFKRWSDWRTWGASAKVRGVPGTGARRWADVMIPCGKAVLLDVPDISVGKLRIRGWLKIADDPSLPKIHVRAAYIMVFGRLTAGEPDKHFSNRVTFMLFQNFKQSRASYALQFYKPSDPNNPRDLGHKTFAVVRSGGLAGGAVRHFSNPSPYFSTPSPHFSTLTPHPSPQPTPPFPPLPPPPLHSWSAQVGGQVALYGMPGGSNTPSWVGGQVALYGMPGGGNTPLWVGGQVALYGMPGGSSTPSWVRLTETADAGDRAIYVNADVTRWAQGMTVALASTSANLNDAEHHVITSVSVVTPASRPGKSDGRYKINLKTALKKRHDGVKISDGVGGTVGIYGEVALLDRHIVITGSDEPAPYQYDGGNFMVYMTPTAQKIVGVHSPHPSASSGCPSLLYVCCESTQNTPLCSISYPCSRCALSDPLPFPPSLSLIPFPLSAPLSSSPSPSPLSAFVFWLEANPYMRGLSKLLPNIGSTVPFYYNWGTWDGNHAHSNALFGFRTYPHGSRPHYPSPTKNPRVSLKNFLVYRNKAGMFFFNSERLIVENGVFLDNGIGIDLSRNAGVQAKGCRFIGRSSSSCSSSNAVTTTTAFATTTATTQETSNGSDGSIPPDGTITDNSSAADATTPPPESLPGNDTTATTPPNAPDNSTLPGNGSSGGDGAATTPPNPPDSSLPQGPTTLWQPFTLQASLGPLDPYADDGSTDSSSGDSGSKSTTSSGNKAFEDAGMTAPAQGAPSGVVDPMGPSLQDQAGTYSAPIGIALSQSNPQDHLYPNSIQDSSFHRFGSCSSSSFGIALVANKAGGYWNTAMFVKSSGTPPRGGLVARFYALRDVDGSLLGQSGYAVANYDPILPPSSVRSAKCDFKSAFSAYSCTSVCYRTVGLEYDEYGATSRGGVLRPYSYLKITRMDDGTFFHAYGTDNDDPKRKAASSKRRFLTASLLAGYTYRIQIIAADTNSEFYPSKMQLNVFDWQGCTGSVRVVIDSPNSSSKWRADVPTVPCSAANEMKVYKEYACGEGKSRLRLDIGASSSGKAAVVMDLNQGVSTSCSSDSGCSSITSAALPPLSIAPLVDIESAFSSTDPFFDLSFYAGGADDPHTVL